MIFYNLITENIQSGILINSTGNVEIFFNTIHNNGYDGVMCMGEHLGLLRNRLMMVADPQALRLRSG